MMKDFLHVSISFSKIRDADSPQVYDVNIMGGINL